MQTIRRRQYQAKKEDLERIEQTQEKAVAVIQAHLFQPLREMERAGHARLEIACAFIMFGYHILRLNRSEESAKDAFNILTHFSQRRIERNIRQKKKQKLSKLN
jgi:hypothetical protein